MLPVVVGFDVDDVLADFAGYYRATAQHLLRRPLPALSYSEWDVGTSLGLTKAEQRTVEVVMKGPGIARRLAPLPQALQGVLDVKLSGAEVVFVTAPYREAPTWAADRGDWLQDHFGELGERVLSTRFKEFAAVDILVEDRGKNLERWAANYSRNGGKLGICAAYPHNAYLENYVKLAPLAPPIVRAHTWDEIVKIAAGAARSLLGNKEHYAQPTAG